MLGNCKLQIANRKLQTFNLKFRGMRGPRSLSRAWPARSGLSLLEVLFAMFVTAVGIMGLAALVPLGGHYTQGGTQLDRAGAAGRAAQRQVEVMEMLRWENWLQRRNNLFLNNPTPWTGTDGTGGNFSRPFTFLIDPLYHARNADTSISNTDTEFFPHLNQAATNLPAIVMPRISLTCSRRRSDPHPQINNFVLDGVALPPASPQRNQYIIPNTAMPLGQADSIFTLRDELSFPENVKSLARPVITPINDNNTAAIGDDAGTQVTGKYSWAAMVRPADAETAYRYPGSLATQPGALTPDDRREFHVSVIVFYGRDFSTAANAERQIDRDGDDPGTTANEGGSNNPADWHYAEFVGDDTIAMRTRDAAGLAPNQWIMVSGARKAPPSPESNPGAPITDHYWYRITHIGKGTPERVMLRVAGPRWNNSLYQASSVTGSTIWVTIVKNVVGVFERTVEVDHRSLMTD